jgi:hypothetical protein
MQPALTPWPLQVLLGRVAREWETRHRIFDLPSGKFHHVDPTADLGPRWPGVATSIGLATPHRVARRFLPGPGFRTEDRAGAMTSRSPALHRRG